MATSYPTPAAPALYTAASPAPPTGSITRAFVAPIFVFFFASCALGVTAVIAPKFEDIFRDFGVALPELTRALLALGGALRSPLGFIAAAGSLGVLCAACGLLAYRSTRFTVLCIVLAILLAAVYMGVFFASMNGPLRTISQSLQQAPAQP